MGNKNTKSSLRNAIVILSISADTIKANDDKFWEQIWVEDPSKASEIIRGIRTQEIRMLRDGSPRNFAILAYKMIERLREATLTLCNTPSQQTAVINAARILIRILPCMFEDRAWHDFFMVNRVETTAESNANVGPKLIVPSKSDQERDYTSYLPIKPQCNSPVSKSQNQPHDAVSDSSHDSKKQISRESEAIENDSLLKSLLLSICDLLFCPEFTVPSHSHGYLLNSIDGPPEDLKSLATCDYVWEPGVGFDSSINSTTYYDKSRSVLLRLLLTCLSTTLYETFPSCVTYENHWIEILVSKENRHALPLFTSLLNVIFSYNPTRTIGFNHLFFEDTREELVELAIQIMIAALDYSIDGGPTNSDKFEVENLFVEYMSRIHRDEDFTFIVRGLTRLLKSQLEQSFLVGSNKQIKFEHELLILNWKLYNLNKRLINHLLKTQDVLDIVIPILHRLSENFQDPSKTALIHIGVFNMLILSGERNFGVRLNKPYLDNALIDLPAFTGSYADLMIIVFHKLILYGYNLNQLFDFLLTIIVNISPYIKTLSMVASNCLIQLFEIFSSSAVIFTEPKYHQLVIFLLEIFNNIIQYQFDGNCNLIYVILNRKDLFLNLANMPTSQTSIQKVLKRLLRIKHEHLAKFGVTPDESVKNMDTSTSSTESNVASNMILLLATPYISDVTHPTNPNLEMLARRELDKTFKQHELEDKNQLSLDEILNQSSFGTKDLPIMSMCVIDSTANEDKNDIASLIALEKDPKESLDGNDGTSNETSPEFDVESTSGTSTINDIDCNKRQRPSPSWKLTPKWLKEWKQSLPLQTILRMIEVLVPQVDKLIEENSGQRDGQDIIKFLQNGTLVGLLPVPHPILIRKYHTNEETTLWFRVCTWTIIYHRNPIWSGTEVKLIKSNH